MASWAATDFIRKLADQLARGSIALLGIPWRAAWADSRSLSRRDCSGCPLLSRTRLKCRRPPVQALRKPKYGSSLEIKGHPHVV